MAWEKKERLEFNFGDDGHSNLLQVRKMEVTVYHIRCKVDWVYDSPPKRVRFTNDGKKESKTKNFVVTRSGGGKVKDLFNCRMASLQLIYQDMCL